MSGNNWNWKAKDGTGGGLLYDSGNWGDLLKMLWVAAVIDWKRRNGARVNYRDPFAGDVSYPLGKKTGFRLADARLARLDFIRKDYLDKGLWPSAASGARLLAGGSIEVWDADPGRRGNWGGLDGVTVPEADSGWTLLAERKADPHALVLVDPYDFLAEWREMLPLVIETAGRTTLLLYLYNRSGRGPEAFANYRAFRNALDDAWGDRPKRLGRVAGDAFLPRTHHEMLILPGEADRAGDDVEKLFDELGRLTGDLTAVQEKAAVFDC